MSKPTPNYVRYEFSIGELALVKGALVAIHADGTESSLTEPTQDSPAEVAAVLLSLAKHLLDRVEDPEVSKTVVLDAGVLDVAGLRRGSNDLMNEMNENEMKGKDKNDTASKETGRSKIKTHIRALLLESGIPEDWLRYAEGLGGGFTGILNNEAKCPFPVKSFQTFMAKDKHQRALPVWLKKNPAPKAQAASASGDQGGDSAAAPKVEEQGLSTYLEGIAPGDEVEVPKSKAFEIED